MMTALLNYQYARYREGNCSFKITEGKDVTFLHTMDFNTAPKGACTHAFVQTYSIYSLVFHGSDVKSEGCTGIDQVL